jgi:hypothetical protein
MDHAFQTTVFSGGLFLLNRTDKEKKKPQDTETGEGKMTQNFDQPLARPRAFCGM